MEFCSRASIFKCVLIFLMSFSLIVNLAEAKGFTVNAASTYEGSRGTVCDSEKCKKSALCSADEVDRYLNKYRNYFSDEQIFILKRQLLKLKKEDFLKVTKLDLKNPTGTLVVSMLLGYTGLDRFLLGDIPLGILKFMMFLSLGFGHWEGLVATFDTAFIKDRTREKNFDDVMNAICGN